MRRNTIIPLKFRHRLDTFYPLPVTYNWKSPQDELNDIREAARVHRRRYVRKYVIATNSFEEEELNKLQFGGDGAMAETKLSDARAAISPMPNADLGAQHFEGIQTSTNDFDNVAGISAQQRGESTGASATETSIVDKRSTIRESRDRIIVANWLCEIAKVMLLEIKERTTLDFWVKVLIDEANDDDQLAEISEQWTLITKEEITGDEDFDVNVSVTSLSPVAQQADKSDYIEFLSVLQQFPIVSMSPHLIRETANKLGYRNENVIRVFQKLAQAAMFEKLAGAENIIEQAMQGGGGTGAGQLGQKTIAQAQPNTQEQITNQLQNPSTRVQ